MTALEPFWPVVVDSDHGHRFIGTDYNTDDESYEACMTCGAMYALRDRGDGTGRYESADGTPAHECTRDTSMAHGYPGERVCEACDGSGCDHCAHDCACLFCA